MSDELDAFNDPWQRDQDLDLADKIYSAARSELSPTLQKRMDDLVAALLARHGYDPRIYAARDGHEDQFMCAAE